MIKYKHHVYILSAVAILGSLLYFFFDPSFSRFFPPCPFFTLTGLYCPGCGSQRAFHDLLHGNIAGAASHNLLFVAALPIVGLSAVATVNNLFSNRKISQPLVNSQLFAITVFVAVILFWLLRNIPTAPFNRLSP